VERTVTTRHSGYQIILADDIREDDAEALIGALYMIKGVIKVVPIEADYDDVLARCRRDSEWERKLLAVLDEMR
jgi:hypothetical protein